MTKHEVIDLASDTPLFEKDKWIGRGRTYPKNPVEVPWEVASYCKALLVIPSEFAEEAFPDNNIGVEAFLALKLPKVSFSVVHIQPDRCFRKLVPNQDAHCLLTRPIPSQGFVERLKGVFGQAILDGNISVEDPNFQGSRLPLWSIQFWGEMLEVINAQAEWRKSLTWIEAMKHADTKFLTTARHQLLSLRWNERVDIPGSPTGATTRVFTRLLSNEWIDDGLVNMMFSHLSDRAEQDAALDGFVIIENLRFIHDIEKAASENDHNKPLTTFLKRLEDRIRNTRSDVLIFPVFLKAVNHWLAFKIDFADGAVSYGRSSLIMIVVNTH